MNLFKQLCPSQKNAKTLGFIISQYMEAKGRSIISDCIEEKSRSRKVEKEYELIQCLRLPGSLVLTSSQSKVILTF
jgi:hypothetical protein